MHGLINRSIQSYVCNSYGLETWHEVTAAAELDFVEFEAMLTYEDALTPRVLDQLALTLDRPRDEIMEDIGTYLVSHPDFESVRRLLRFGGVTFEEFLYSLDDMPDRARLAVADLKLPGLQLCTHGDGMFSLICDAPIAGYGHVMMGILRVMADDYGVLALLDHTGTAQGQETLSISLVATDFSEGRSFELGVSAR
jgi:hypothetical protein